jgi:hypothetical protein
MGVSIRAECPSAGPNQNREAKERNVQAQRSRERIGRFEFTHVAVLESADDAREGTVCGDYFRVADNTRGRYPARSGSAFIRSRSLRFIGDRLVAKSVPNGIALRQVLSDYLLLGKKELTTKQLSSFPCPTVRYRCWAALYAAFRRPAFRTTGRPEAFRD